MDFAGGGKSPPGVVRGIEAEDDGEIDRESEDDEEDYRLQHYRPPTPELRPVGVVRPLNVSVPTIDSPQSPDFDHSELPLPPTPGTSSTFPNAESANAETVMIDLVSDDE